MMEAEKRCLSSEGPAGWDGRLAGSPAPWRWMRSPGRSEVSTVLSTGARRWTLATKTMGPPTTWKELHLSSLPELPPQLCILLPPALTGRERVPRDL